MRLAAAAVGLWVGITSAAAQAGDSPADSGAEERLALLPLEIEGDDARVSKAVSSRLLDGLERGEFVVLEAPPSALAAPCVAPACERGVALATSARYVIRASVAPRDNVYDIVLEARDAEGDVIATVEDTCEICGLTELGDLVSDRGAALAEQLALLSAAPPVVVVNTEPSGANVWVDEQLIGRTPLEHQVAAGSHEIRVEAPGYVGQRRTITAVAGVRDEVEINLARSAVETVEHPGRGMIIGGAVSLVAGVGLIGGGVPLIVIDSTEIGEPDDPSSGCNPDSQGNCERLYDTLGLGAGLAGVGSAAVAAGVALLAVGLVRRNKASSRFAASPSGLSVRF